MLVFFGALIGIAAVLLWACLAALFGFDGPTDSQQWGLVGAQTILTPVAIFAICILDEAISVRAFNRSMRGKP